jgi:hypothetical protein
MIDEVFQTAENFKALWVSKARARSLIPQLTLLQFAHFCGYSAVVALYIFIIRYPKTNKIKKYLKAAEKCEQQIKQSGDTESFAKHCIGVLEELHSEAATKLEGSRPGDGGMSAASRSAGSDSDAITSRSRRAQPQGERQSAKRELGSKVVDKINRWGFSSLLGY